MANPLKYLPGPAIRSVEELADQISAGRYIIHKWTGQRINPAWAASWQFRMCMNGVRKGVYLRAIPNPEHPDNKEAR